MMKRALLMGAMASLLAACATTPPRQTGQTPPPRTAPPVITRPPPIPIPTAPPPTPVSGFRAPEIMRVPGLEWVIQQDARVLSSYFGRPRLDVTEGDARKLQFAGAPCVLDIVLYPLRSGADPVATYVEARRASDGEMVSAVDCANALRR